MTAHPNFRLSVGAFGIAIVILVAAAASSFTLPTVAPAGPSTSPTSLHSLGTGAAEATGDRP